MVGDLYAQDAHYLLPNPQAPVLEGKERIKKSFAGFMHRIKENRRNVDISFALFIDRLRIAFPMTLVIIARVPNRIRWLLSRMGAVWVSS